MTLTALAVVFLLCVWVPVMRYLHAMWQPLTIADCGVVDRIEAEIVSSSKGGAE